MTNLPPPDEPDIYEGLVNALIAASRAYREALVHFQAALPRVHDILELHQPVQPFIDEASISRPQAVAAQTFARAYQASSAMIQGLEIWNDAEQSLRAGLELATMLLQAERRLQTESDNPDALTA